MASWSGKFWKATAERVVGTAAASGIAVLSVANPTGIDWQQGLVLTGIASAVTFLKCIVANTATDDGPGFTNAEGIKNGQ